MVIFTKDEKDDLYEALKTVKSIRIKTNPPIWVEALVQMRPELRYRISREELVRDVGRLKELLGGIIED